MASLVADMLECKQSAAVATAGLLRWEGASCTS